MTTPSLDAATRASASVDVPDPRTLALRLHAEILLGLSRSAELDARDVAPALRKLTEAASRGVGVERASVWLFEDGGQALVCHDLFEATKKEHASGIVLLSADYPAYFAALAENRTIAAEHARSHPATREFAQGYLEPLGITSMLEAPIRRAGRVVGVLCHEHVGAPRPFSLDEEHLAASIADLVARALDARDRHAAEERLREINARLEHEVEERTRALARRDAENRELILQLRAAIDQLSTPVLEVWDDVLALPLVGMLDSTRTATITERVLTDVARSRARYVLVDLTGVDVVDTSTADRLAKLARSIQLLGARCVITGLRPAVAQALIDLGADLAGLPMMRNLKEGLVVAMDAPARARAVTSAERGARR